MVLTAALAAIGMLSVSVTAQTIEVQLTIEAFDGCGCQPLDPPNCGVCDNLDGNGCNAHVGVTNTPSPYCASLSGWPHPFPNPDVNGPDSIDQNWGNIGGAMEYSGDYENKNGVEPANQASQRFVLASGRVIKAAWPWEGAALGYIDPNNPQDIVGNIYGRMHIDAIREAYNAAHPDAVLPPPLMDQPAYITIDIRRVGGGLVGQPDLVLKPSLWPPSHNPDPADLVVTYNTGLGVNEVPNDSTWHTYRLADLNKYPLNVYMGVYLDFMVGSAGGTSATTDEDVTVWIDNLKLVYTALPLPEVCGNGVDDDADTKVDCADPDCYYTPNCPCDPYIAFDVDHDSDVDQADFSVLQACVPGTAGTLLSDVCDCLDITGPDGNKDGTLDQQDFVAFEACASGPGVAADQACDD
jgi:hypothetical protein